MDTSNRGAYGQFLSLGQHQEVQNMGKRIEALRLARGWSQSEAARQLEISQPSLSDIESGETKSLSGKTLAMVCRTFHTTAEYVYFGSASTDDPELPLIEAELIYMARVLTPDRRQTALDSIRGIFRGQPGSDRNDPFEGRQPGDSQPAELTGSGAKPYKAKLIPPFLPAKKPGKVRKEG